MNCKKTIILATSLLLGVSTLTACTGQSKKVTFNDYWKADSITKQENLTEELEYSISYEKSKGLGNYELNYLNGKYTTKLATEEYEGKTVYVYETKLEIDVTYQLGGSVSEAFHDVVTSKVRFEQSSGALRPIDSHKEVLSHSPVNTEVSTLEQCYKIYEYNMDIDYVNMTSVLDFKGESPEKIENKVSFDSDYTALDNDQLLFAIRGLTQTESSSATFSIYSPFVNAAQKVKTSFGAETGEDFSFTQNGAATKSTIQYFPVSIVLDEKNPGQTQTAWVAKTTDPSNNKYRNVVLRHSVPLSYNLGSLVYKLTSANFSSI